MRKKGRRTAAAALAMALSVTSVFGTGMAVGAADLTVSQQNEKNNNLRQAEESNLALNKPARASKYLEAAGGIPARTPELAVDGVALNGSDQNSRWQSGEDQDFTEQWLEIDLGKESLVSRINVKFFAKLYGNFTIETSASNADDATWTPLKSVELPSSDDRDVVKEVDMTENGAPSEVQRYVRLRFTSGNDNAMNKSIAVYEFEVIGTQESSGGSEGSGDGEYEVFTGNIARGKSVTASGIENGVPNAVPEKVVDGSFADDSRWAASQMKSGNDVNQQQTPQWLEINLLNEVTDITSIKLSFYLLVRSTDYEIQTRANQTDAWRTVKHVQTEPTSTRDEADIIDDVESLDKYVRFYFNKVNTSAGGNSVSIREIEINGSQVQTPDVTNPTPDTAQEMLNQITIPEITADMTEIPLPESTDKFDIHVKGSEYPQVVTDDGKISGHNMYDYTQQIIVEVVNKEVEGQKAEKAFDVTIPNKRANDAALYPTVSKQNKEPKVIPSLQEWYGYEGDFELSKDSKIILKDDAGLGIRAAAENFQSDMEEITGWTLDIVEGGNGTAKDIVVQSTTEDLYDAGEEGYLLKADESGVEIISSGYNGCLYGLTTLEQVFYTQKGEFTFPYGVTRDFPQYEIRGIMIDIARTPYRIEALRDIVKSLSFYKINEVHFHLNDNRHIFGNDSDRPNYDFWNNAEGMLRLESEKFPSLKTDPKKDAYYNEVWGGAPQYTKEEYIDLQELAMSYGINPISEIDGPGHSLLFTRYVKNNLEEVQEIIPEMTEAGIQSDRNWELVSLKGETGEHALKFMQELMGEYLDDNVFLGDTVDIGVDEYWQIKNDELDGMHRYMREMSDQIQDSGKKVRMWSSLLQYCDQKGIDATQYNDIVLDFWSNVWENASRRISEGFQIVNVDSPYLYGNTGRDGRDIVNVEWVFNNWTPRTISGSNLKKAEPNLLGAKTALWADVADMGVMERDNLERILRQSAIVCEKTWGGTDADQTFAEYSFKYESLRQGPGVELGAGPETESGLVMAYDFENVKDNTVYDISGNGYNGTIKNGEVVEENGKAWLKLDGSGEVTTALRSLDYPYTVQFDLKLSEAVNEEACLFDGKDGRLTIKANGNLGLNRSYFDQDFGYKIPLNEEVKVTVVGTQQVTKLYVNGNLVKALTRTSASENDFAHLLSTFVFPLTTIGKDLNGSIADIRAYEKALSPEIIQKIAQGQDVTVVNVSQDKAAAGVAQRVGEGGQDNAEKKLRVGWKALDGDGNTLDGRHSTDVSEKDSYFEGRYADSTFAVDMWEEYDISKLVLQWDTAPAKFKLQTSEDGVNWTDLQEVTGEAVNTISFATPVQTRYLRIQGVQGTYKLREFEAYEAVDKAELKSALTEAEEKCTELDIDFANHEGYDAFYEAYVAATGVQANVLAEQSKVNAAAKVLKEALAALDEEPEPSDVEVEKVELSVDKRELEIGDTLKVNAVVTPEDATDKTLTWTTSDAKVLTVDKDGVVTAVKAGTATVQATASNGVKASITLIVKEPTQEELEILVGGLECNVDLKTLKVGDEVEFTFNVINPNEEALYNINVGMGWSQEEYMTDFYGVVEQEGIHFNGKDAFITELGAGETMTIQVKGSIPKECKPGTIYFVCGAFVMAEDNIDSDVIAADLMDMEGTVLEEKTEPGKPEPEKPEPEKPGTGDENQNGGDGNSKDKDGKPAATGDNNFFGGYVIFMLLAGTVVIVLKKKQRNLLER